MSGQVGRCFATICSAVLFSFSVLSGYAQTERSSSNIEYLDILKKSYPDVTFDRIYDSSKDDWLIIMSVPVSGDGGLVDQTELYWADGSFLPESELAQKLRYWPILYPYELSLTDPADLTEAQKDAARRFSADDSRKNSAGTPMYFFDALYHADSREQLEAHLVRTTFLGHATRVHERIMNPLKRVEQQITVLARTDEDVQNFIKDIKSADGYYWRIIAGTNRKSFHSLGIAVDILPKSTHGKEIFWSWAKSKNPDNWMLTPLSQRWMPPLSVIELFENEGFIWGGRWGIWDNMHFEYHPELIAYSKIDKEF